MSIKFYKYKTRIGISFKYPGMIIHHYGVKIGRLNLHLSFDSKVNKGGLETKIPKEILQQFIQYPTITLEDNSTYREREFFYKNYNRELDSYFKGN